VRVRMREGVGGGGGRVQEGRFKIACGGGWRANYKGVAKPPVPVSQSHVHFLSHPQATVDQCYSFGSSLPRLDLSKVLDQRFISLR
jgi:hypothetical protein